MIAIVGETASGKSALAMELAVRFNGEIICADSRTVYRAMDIGTAKPTGEEQSKIRHYGLDLVDPDERFTVADFKDMAVKTIEEIESRGKLPILVGGTGLYIDSILYDFQFLPVADSEERERLSKISVDELQAEILDKGLPTPFNDRNPRHLSRVIETKGRAPAKQKLRPDALIFGISVPREQLKERIAQRVDGMLAAGLIDEIEQLSKRYGWEVEAMRAPAYKAFRGYLEGEINLEEARQRFIQNDLNLAKKQRTWFKRNSSIQWYSDPKEIVEFVTTTLNKRR